jgi:hypothetical protein
MRMPEATGSRLLFGGERRADAELRHVAIALGAAPGLKQDSDRARVIPGPIGDFEEQLRSRTLRQHSVEPCRTRTRSWPRWVVLVPGAPRVRYLISGMPLLSEAPRGCGRQGRVGVTAAAVPAGDATRITARTASGA